MKKIVIVTMGITSYVNSLLKLGNALKAKGHEVLFVCLDENSAEEQIRANGFAFEVFMATGNAVDEGAIKKKPWSIYNYWKYHYQSLKAFRNFLLNDRRIGEFVDHFKPDAFIVPSEMTYTTVALYQYKVPVVQVQFFPSPNKSAGTPLPHSNIIPGTPMSKIRIQVEWFRYLFWMRLKNITQKLLYGGQDYRTTMILLARKSKFPLSAIDFRSWKDPTIMHAPELVLCPDEFDFPRKLLSNQVTVGPFVALSRKESGYDEAYSHFKKKIDEKPKTPDGSSVVYCAFGSTGFKEKEFMRVIEELIAVFNYKKKWILLLAIGPKLKISQFKNVPENVYIYNYVPQLDALWRADIMITHGGLSSISECIMIGVPMLVISGENMEQNGNSARIRYHRLGLSGKLNISTRQIMAKLETILSDPVYKTNIEKMKKVYIEYEKKQLAATFIEDLISQEN